MTDIQFPAPGDSVPATHPSPEMLKALSQRRSVTAALMGNPGPSAEQLDQLLAIASRVPDHRKVAPFRFIVFEGEARSAFGDVLVAASKDHRDLAHIDEAQIKGLFARAPVVVAVISSVDKAHKTPEWEQVLTSGVVCFNLLLAASAMGYAGQWLTEWYAYDAKVHQALGMTETEKVAGFIYLGTAQEAPMERARPDLTVKTVRWTAT